MAECLITARGSAILDKLPDPHLRVDTDSTHRRTSKQFFSPSDSRFPTVRTSKYTNRSTDRVDLRLSTVYDSATVCCFRTIRYVSDRCGEGFRRIATACFLAYNLTAKSSRYIGRINVSLYSYGWRISYARYPWWWKSEFYWKCH